MTKTHFDILIAANLINSDQIQEAQANKKGQESVLDYLVNKKITTFEAVAKAYAAHTNLEYLEKITENMADTTLLGSVPLKFLKDNGIIPIKKDGTVCIATADPLDFAPIDQLSIVCGPVTKTVVTTAAIIIGTINKYYPLEGTKEAIQELEQEAGEPENVSLEGIDDTDIMSSSSEAPIIKLVNHILFQAVKQGASDIHIEPFEKEMRIRYRIDGVMYDSMTPPKRVQNALISRLKIMGHMNIAEKRLPQGGRIAIKVADKSIDIRVSILPVAFGERVVMRLLDKSKNFAHIEDLGMSEHDFAIMNRGIVRPNGIIYVTGPTGSGKTSTLYSILARLNTADVNIITVEDPIEYQMSGIGQVGVKDKIGLNFAAALREILRQDPDIIMIGETRDQETAQIAIQAALTGHLVLSTLHTNSAPAAITRLIDMGIEPFLIASSVVIVLAQRLIRKLCDECKKSYTPTEESLKRIGIVTEQAKGITFYQSVGCEKCSNLGYKGRKPIFEIMEMSPSIAALTMQKADTAVITQKAVEEGMTLLVQDGVRAIKEGVTTIEEVLSVAVAEYDTVA
jgi:general secretion pathway protein E